MNSVAVKYKPLFYSLSIHLLIAMLIVFAYIKYDKPHEVHSLVNLNSIHFSSPAVQMVLTTEVKKPKVKKTQAIPVETKVKKKEIVKKQVTPKLKAKPVPVKKVEVAKAIAPVQEELKPIEKTEAAEEPLLAVNSQSQATEEEVSQTLVTTEPKVDYEAQYMKDNIALINALIRKNLSYPRLAKKRGLQGKAMVSFTLNEEGKVLDIEAMGIVASILKRSAIKTVEKASSSFPHPKVALALRIPIVYKLN